MLDSMLVLDDNDTRDLGLAFDDSFDLRHAILRQHLVLVLVTGLLGSLVLAKLLLDVVLLFLLFFLVVLLTVLVIVSGSIWLLRVRLVLRV